MKARRIKGDRSKGATRKTYVLGVIAILVGLALSGARASAATLYVGTCQPTGKTTIQDAVDAAASGDTIYVCPGTYPGPVTIDGKNLTLQGLTAKGSQVYPTLVYLEGEHQCAASCNQIYAEDGATVSISKLNIDGSGFTESCQAPTGIELLNASGTITNTNITNHVSACDSDEPYGGYGIFADNGDSEGNYTVNISNSTISNFGYEGIFVSGFFSTIQNVTGKVANNTVTQTKLGGVGISVGDANNYSVTSNTVALQPATTGSDIGLNLYDDNNLTASLNTTTGNNFGVVATLTSSTINFNTISQVGIGMDLGLTSSSVGFNTLTGNGPNSQAGIMLGGDHNTIVLNSISDFCSGIQISPSTSDTNIVFNAFQNIGPGANITNAEICEP
jgi:hypothetical protein